MLKEKMTAKIKEQFPNAEVTFSDVTKNNGVVFHGCSIREDDARVTPIIYYDENNLTEDTADEIAATICEQYLSHKNDLNADDILSTCFTKEYILNNVMPMILNFEKNYQMAEKKSLAFEQVLDLMVVYRVDIVTLEGATFKVTKDVMEKCDITEQELKEHALENLKSHLEIMSMQKMMLELMGVKCDDELGEDDPMKVYTTKDRYYGASTMLLGDVLGKNCYILPSSVHEIIVIAADDLEGASVDDLHAMVKEVNSTQVGAGEVLSDNVYYYDGVEVKIA